MTRSEKLRTALIIIAWVALLCWAGTVDHALMNVTV